MWAVLNRLALPNRVPAVELAIGEQGWAEGSFVEAEVEAERSRQRRGKAAMSLTERGKARPCEAEARPSQLKKTASRPPRAEADASRTTSLLESLSMVSRA